jgi:hypothetical protein
MAKYDSSSAFGEKENHPAVTSDLEEKPINNRASFKIISYSPRVEVFLQFGIPINELVPLST